MLVSRTAEKLQAAAKEIEATYKVDTKVLAVDFSTLNEGSLSSIQKLLESLDVGILINNVGLSYSHAEYLDAIDDKLIDDLVEVNIVAATKVLPPTLLCMLSGN